LTNKTFKSFFDAVVISGGDICSLLNRSNCL